MKIERMTHDAVPMLWHAGFPEDTDAFIDAYWREHSDQMRAAMLRDDDGEICAGLHVVPQTICVRGAAIPAAMVAGVATKKEKRRRGYAGMLLRDTAQKLRQSGVALAVLDPFRESFYEPYGYRTGSFYRDAVWARRQNVPIEKTDDIARLDRIYRASAADMSGYVLRTKDDWSFRLHDAALDGAAAFTLDDRAYAIAQTDGETIDVWEAMGRSGEDFFAMLSALCGTFQKDAAYRIIAKRSDEEVRHGAMYCPLDLPSIVQSVPTAADGAFSFLVSDAAREEEYTLSWRCENGHAVLTEEKARGSIDAGVLFLTLLGVETKEGAEQDLLRSYPPMTTVLWEQY